MSLILTLEYLRSATVLTEPHTGNW